MTLQLQRRVFRRHTKYIKKIYLLQEINRNARIWLPASKNSLFVSIRNTLFVYFFYKEIIWYFLVTYTKIIILKKIRNSWYVYHIILDLPYWIIEKHFKNSDIRFLKRSILILDKIGEIIYFANHFSYHDIKITSYC